MNVLITCAGRRTTLVSLFQAAVHPYDGCVLAADMDPLAPARLSADVSVDVPPIDAEAYGPALLDLARTHSVDLVVPTIDPELPVLHDLRERLSDVGARALVSTRSFLRLAADKWRTVQHFDAEGVRTPTSWKPGALDNASLPDVLFVKPCHGSSSEEARLVSRGHLAAALDGIEGMPIIQEVIKAPEITVDALFDFEGTLLHYVPRRRLRTQAGESIQGRTLPDEDLAPWLRPVLRHLGTLGARGPVTLQAFLTDGEPTLSEINPRFGGGFPLSHEAGARYPEWLVALCTGASASAHLGAYQEGLCMTRAYTEFFVDARS